MIERITVNNSFAILYTLSGKDESGKVFNVLMNDIVGLSVVLEHDVFGTSDNPAYSFEDHTLTVQVPGSIANKIGDWRLVVSGIWKGSYIYRNPIAFSRVSNVESEGIAINCCTAFEPAQRIMTITDDLSLSIMIGSGTGGAENVIEEIRLNDEPLPVVDKSVNIDLTPLQNQLDWHEQMFQMHGQRFSDISTGVDFSINQVWDYMASEIYTPLQAVTIQASTNADNIRAVLMQVTYLSSITIPELQASFSDLEQNTNSQITGVANTVGFVNFLLQDLSYSVSINTTAIDDLKYEVFILQGNRRYLEEQIETIREGTNEIWDEIQTNADTIIGISQEVNRMFMDHGDMFVYVYGEIRDLQSDIQSWNDNKDSVMYLVMNWMVYQQDIKYAIQSVEALEADVESWNIVSDDLSYIAANWDSINANIVGNSIDIQALQSEATSKWITLNEVDTRSRSNEIALWDKADKSITIMKSFMPDELANMQENGLDYWNDKGYWGIMVDLSDYPEVENAKSVTFSPFSLDDRALGIEIGLLDFGKMESGSRLLLFTEKFPTALPVINILIQF